MTYVIQRTGIWIWSGQWKQKKNISARVHIYDETFYVFRERNVTSFQTAKSITMLAWKRNLQTKKWETCWNHNDFIITNINSLNVQWTFDWYQACNFVFQIKSTSTRVVYFGNSISQLMTKFRVSLKSYYRYNIKYLKQRELQVYFERISCVIPNVLIFFV